MGKGIPKHLMPVYKACIPHDKIDVIERLLLISGLKYEKIEHSYSDNCLYLIVKKYHRHRKRLDVIKHVIKNFDGKFGYLCDYQLLDIYKRKLSWGY